MAGTELATAYVSLVASTEGMSRDIKKALGSAEKESGRSGKRMGGLMSSGIASQLGNVAKVAGLAGVGASAGAALMGGFNAAINTQNTKSSLTGLYGSAADAADMIKRIGDVSRKSPIDTKAYESAAVSLAYLGVKGEESQNILRNVGLAITAAGGDSQQIDQATNALTNMVNEGKVTRETLNQLSGAGVPVFSALADAMGVTSDELSGIIQKGGVGLDDVLGVLQNGTGELFQQMIAGGKETEQTFGNTWKRVKKQVTDSIGNAILPALDSMAPKMAGIADAVAAGAGKLPEVFSRVGDIGRSVFDALRPTLSSVADSLSSMWDTAKTLVEPLKNIGEAMAPFAKAAIGAALAAVSGAFKAMSVVVKPLAAMLRGVGDFAKDHTTTFRVLAGVVIGMVGTWKAYKAAAAAVKAVQLGMAAASYGAAGATYAVGGATRVYNALMKKQAIQTAIVTGAQKARAAATYVVAGAQRALNMAMRMNPIGLIITAIAALVAGIVIAYQKSETFRNIVQSVWQAIQTAVLWAWNNVLKPVWDAIQVALSAVGNAFVWVWNSLIKPAWDALGAGINWVWTNIVQPVWNALKFALAAVGTAFQFYWNNVIKPAWNALGTGISWVWVNIIQPAWNALKAALNAVGLFFQWVWNSIIKPTWDALGAGIRWVWENVIRPAWDGLKASLDAVGKFFQWIWNSIIKPAWDALGTGIRWVIDNVIKPAWNGMKTALQSVADFFGNVVDGIKTVWDKLKGYLATPINFLIGVVWNKGILAAWNKVAEFLPGLNPAQPLSQLAEGHQFATGGAVSGPGGPTSDSIAARLSHGEHVFDAGDVKALGGQRAVYALRALIDRGIPFTWDTVKGLAAMPMASIQSMKNAPRGTDIIGGLNPETIPGFKDGGAPTEPAWKAQLENGHRAAKMRNGNPYTWGFEDCSGYMSMIADAIINGGDGVRRWATSSFPGGQPWVPGLGEGFSVGVHDNPGGPGGGHTAGTLTGVGPYATVNVESGGSHGNVAYGGPAAGADDPQWDGVSPGRFHLAIGADGAFESAGPGGVDKGGFLVKKIHEIIEKLIGPIKGGISAAIGDPPPEWLGIPPEFLDLATHGVTDFLVDKIGSLGDLLGSVYNKAKDLASDVLHVVSFGLFDNGGWLQPGMNLIANKTGKPEPVLNPEQWRLMEQLLESMTGGKPLDMEHLADVAATFQKSTEDALKNAGKSFMDDAFGVVGFPGFDRWTKVGDEYQKALEARRKMDEDKRKQEAEANKPKDEATAESPVVPIEQQPTTTGTYQDPQYGDPTVVKGTEAVELDKMPDISSGGGAGGDAVAAVKRAFEPYGWSTGDMWSAAEWIIGKESSWNPTARNPSSGAFGLFQFLGSTKDQYLPDENPDPYIQGQAGARYIQDRYGNPMNAKAFWEQNGWYDNGGWLQPGLTLVENRTGRPEPVFSPQQWATLEANINTGGGAGGGPRTVIRQEVTVADQKSAVRELSRQARRDMMVHGG